MSIGVCDDLRMGGTLSATGITGGTSIQSRAIQVADWSGVYGYVGLTGSVVEVNGRPGGYIAGDLLGMTRFLELPMRFTRMGPAQTLVEATDCEQLVANTDDFFRLLAVPNQLLELDMPDGTSRFLTITAFDRAPLDVIGEIREGVFPATSPWPYWREGGNQQTDTISGADTLAAGGNVSIYDAVLVFAGDGTFEHTTLGWEIEVTGSGGPVTVDLGNRTVTEGGLPATNRIRRTNRDWGWFTPGNNSVTSDVSVVVTWRDQWM
jgi:hypothetical protein